MVWVTKITKYIWCKVSGFWGIGRVSPMKLIVKTGFWKILGKRMCHLLRFVLGIVVGNDG
jgi:hypothetical protein